MKTVEADRSKIKTESGHTGHSKTLRPSHHRDGGDSAPAPEKAKTSLTSEPEGPSSLPIP